MQLHQLKRTNPNTSARRVGRGGKRGKTSGRGTKGQKARAGHKIRPEVRDVIKKLPKLRGYSFKAFREKSSPVNVSALAAFEGEVVTPKLLAERGLVRSRKGKLPRVKILGSGDIDRALTI